ncbi:MAG: hypothetical protein P8X90_05370 [Desulfobacterales bacterium]
MKGSLKRGGNKNGLHAVKAAYSVLIEIVRILGEYRDNIVLIGGWAPQLLFQNEDDRHIGSIDVDLALDHRRITNEVYKGIHDLLLERKYNQGKQPFIFHRQKQRFDNLKQLRMVEFSQLGQHRP